MNVITIAPKAEKTAKELLKDFFNAKAAIENSTLVVNESKAGIVNIFNRLATQCDIDDGDNGYVFDIGHDMKFAKVQKKNTTGTPAKPATRVFDVSKLIADKPELFKKLLAKYGTDIPATAATEATEVYDIRMVNKSSVASKSATKVKATKAKKAAAA